MTCGLSEELGKEIVTRIEAIGVHCAELDRYSYGTPIQLQIIDGIRYSKHRIYVIQDEKNSFVAVECPDKESTIFPGHHFGRFAYAQRVLQSQVSTHSSLSLYSTMQEKMIGTIKKKRED